MLKSISFEMTFSVTYLLFMEYKCQSILVHPYDQ